MPEGPEVTALWQSSRHGRGGADAEPAPGQGDLAGTLGACLLPPGRQAGMAEPLGAFVGSGRCRLGCRRKRLSLGLGTRLAPAPLLLCPQHPQSLRSVERHRPLPLASWLARFLSFPHCQMGTVPALGASELKSGGLRSCLVASTRCSVCLKLSLPSRVGAQGTHLDWMAAAMHWGPGLGSFSWHSPALGRPSRGLLRSMRPRGPSGLWPQETATFFAGKVLWGQAVGVFEANCQSEGVSLPAGARALDALTASAQTAAVCRENAGCVYFSPAPAGSGGLGEEGAGDLRAEETHLRSPPFSPPAWLEEGFLVMD